MKMCTLRLICVLAGISALAQSGAIGQPSESTAAERTWLWVSADAPVPARHLNLRVTPAPGGISPDRTTFHCDILSDFGYRGAQLNLEVREGAGAVISEGSLHLNISAGANTCEIELDTGALPLGIYTARFFIAHDLLLSEPVQELLLRKINADSLLEELEVQGRQIEELARSLDQLEQKGDVNAYLRLKTNLVSDVLAKARANAGMAAWESLDQLLRYGRDRIDSIRAGLVFGAVRPEYASDIETPRLDQLDVHNGVFSAEGHPVYLFGGVLPDLDPAAIALLRRYQFNAATIRLAPDENPSAESTRAARVDRLFDGAADQNVAVAVQLAPDLLPQEVLAANPELTLMDHVDIARPEARAYFEQFISGVSPLLNDRAMLLGVSVANDPRFHFSGPEVKRGFVEYIRANYPDRLTLNRAWRSHLGTLDDITPWSENPYDTYQQHRPYQFDWQTYHQSLGNQYFGWSLDLVRNYLPRVPLTATLANTVFSEGETRYGVNREPLATMMQISGCSARISAVDPVYAMEYPETPVYYNLLKSFQPDQPVFNLYSEMDFAPGMRGKEVYEFVHSAIWEGVMAGLGGATVPMDSLLFDRPEALEAFATAALDVNRLAPIVRAFQSAPADAGILFSYASKVFDDGAPHLESASNAYEGAVFGGYNVRFISESQCVEGGLDDLKILIVPDTPALSDAAFERINAYVERGGTVARTGTPIPYDERGFSRGDLIRNTANTVLVRGLNLPTEYLHAMDAATVLGALPQIPRPITGQGYPVEGVKSQYVEFAGEGYLYLINLRKEPVYCTLATPTRAGRDLIGGSDVEFPATIAPLQPMLIRLEPVQLKMQVSIAADQVG